MPVQPSGTKHKNPEKKTDPGKTLHKQYPKLWIKSGTLKVGFDVTSVNVSKEQKSQIATKWYTGTSKTWQALFKAPPAHTLTLFCFRAPFSFMCGQSLPVTTALISATGTVEKEEELWAMMSCDPGLLQASGVIVPHYSDVLGCTYACPVENREAPLPEDSPPGRRSAVLYDWVTIDNTRTYLRRQREKFNPYSVLISMLGIVIMYSSPWWAAFHSTTGWKQ